MTESLSTCPALAITGCRPPAGPVLYEACSPVGRFRSGIPALQAGLETGKPDNTIRS
jgi:hypothetical protein